MVAWKQILQTYLSNLKVFGEEEQEKGINDEEEIQKETIKGDLGKHQWTQYLFGDQSHT